MTRRSYRSARPGYRSRRLLASAFVVACLLASAFSPAPAQTEDIIPPVDDVLPDLQEPDQREPLGKWEETDAPTENQGETVQRALASGKVFRYSRNDLAEPSAPPSKPEIYEPDVDGFGKGQWTIGELPKIATLDGQDALIQSASVIGGTAQQCGENCGKVLVHFKVCGDSTDSHDPYAWQLYDPDQHPSETAWSDAGSFSPRSPFARAGTSSLPLVENCGVHCGSVLVVGAGFSCGESEDAKSKPELYNASGNWIPTAASSHKYEFWPPLIAPLQDGRIVTLGCDPANKPLSEIFDVDAGGTEVPEPPRCQHGGSGDATSAIALANGGALFMGVDEIAGTTSAQMFLEETWTEVEKACCGTDVLLPGGKVLIVKKDGSGSSILWDPEQPEQSLPAAAPAKIRNPESATFLAGPHCGMHCGKVLLTGTKEGGDELAAELYTPAPDLASLGPAAGPVTGGTRVEINGYSFLGGESKISVDFGGVRGKDVEVLSDTKLRVTAPEGAAAGAVQVRVTTDAGKTPQSDVSRFTFLPAITALTPSRGSMKGGDEIRITGKGLDRTESVQFGTAPAQSFRVVSDTEVRAINPSHSKAEAVPLSLSAQGLSSVPARSGANMFTYLADNPLTTIDTDPDKAAGEGIGPRVSGGVSPVAPGPGPVSGSFFSPGPGTPGSPTSPPSGPLTAPVTANPPPAGTPVLSVNPVPVQSAAVLSQPGISPLTPGLAAVPDEAPQPGRRYAFVGLGGPGSAMYFGVALFAFGLSISMGAACGRTSRRPSHVPGLQRAH